MGNKYSDISAIIQVIGNIYNEPSLLDSEKYFFLEDDFTEEFHKILFGSIYNLYKLGAKKIDLNAIDDYLKQRPKSYAIYEVNKGAEYISKITETVQLSTFEYYYNRMKKMTLMRMYNQKTGMDLNWLYDPDNILDAKKKQAQEDWLDKTSLEEIADLIDKRIIDIRLAYVNNADNNANQAGKDLLSLLQQYRDVPEVGIPLYGHLINTVTRGARLKKVYLRSAASGVGKTRSMLADAANFAVDKIYDVERNHWVNNGTGEPTLYITTEQELSEIQTMLVAFVSGVDEEHILSGRYTDIEWERVQEAVKIIEKAPLYIVEMPDFSLQDIENAIKREIREHGVRYVVHDYIHSSMKILSEISSKASVKSLREDNVLFMLSVTLKDLANKYSVFIETGTQLNGSYVNADIYDQNLLRGAKSIADKVDVGMIMLNVTQEDLESLQPVLENGGLPQPNMKISIYKNRRGRYYNILLWCVADKGICRINPVFATNYQYELEEIEDMQIFVTPTTEQSAF